MIIAIQGFEGSFHASAAKNLYGNSAGLIYCKTFKQVFEKLENNEADKAVVAIENSLYGSINEVYDLLLRYKFFIVGEIYEQIGLHLLAPSGSSLGLITDIYSQAPALAESEAYITRHLPGAEIHEFHDTALAASEVSNWNDKTRASISSFEAAKLYNLDILAHNIETHHNNYTRFIALSKTQNDLSKPTKTSITLETSDDPGSLYAVLGVFAKRGINLSKLESRPIVGKAWHYMYYLDLESAINEHLLTELKKHASDIQILGSYKTGDFKII